MKRVLLFAVLGLFALTAFSQDKSIEDYTRGMEKYEGYFDFWWDAGTGKIWLEVDRWDEEFLYVTSLPAGLGSNDIGLDRNKLGGTRIVYFHRVGPKVLLFQPNYGFRAESDNPMEVKAVEDAFARSVIASFPVRAESGKKVLIDLTAFLLEDVNGIASTLQRSGQGSYRSDASRSAIFQENTKNFPKNTEFEAWTTFVSSAAGRYVRSVSADGSSVTLRQHHSFVELPEPGYQPREWDPRSAYGYISWMDFTVPVGEPLTKRFIRRHRLEKKNPRAAISEAVDPIIYYVDPGTPEPIRTALLEGASWWNQAFEAAGYKDAFQVKVLPEGADPMDIRYNMINWIHRSTRGWSYGASVTDPRTGEIIKGHIALGSQRIRQDYLIAFGLAGEFEEGKAVDPAILNMALQRIRQLSCHEVGHTLGLNHNYAASTTQRASVMDYPHPLVKMKEGKIDLSDAYPQEIGAWDKVTIAYGYQDFPEGTDENAGLQKILENAFTKEGLVYLTDQDIEGAHPYTHQWDNGANAVDELQRVMYIRNSALRSFTEKKVRPGESLSALEEVLVPVYLFHRYQIEAAAKSLGGLVYHHRVRDGVQDMPVYVPAEEQERALELMLKVVSPEELEIPDQVLELLIPRAPGLGQSRELFDGKTGLEFDPLTAAENIANTTFSALLDARRAARMVLHHSLDKEQPDLDWLIDETIKATFHNNPSTPKLDEIQRVVNYAFLSHLIRLSANPSASLQVRAIADMKLSELKYKLSNWTGRTDWTAHYRYCIKLIDQYMDDPAEFVFPTINGMPPGAPIGN